MMRDVRAPKKSYFMPHSMLPIISKIIAEKADYPSPV
jgi:tRNA G10  N-methylase Trm11